MIQLFSLGEHFLSFIRNIGQFLLVDKMEWILDLIPTDGWLYPLLPSFLQDFLTDLATLPIAFLIFGGGLTAFLLYKLIKFVVGIFGG